MRYLGVFGHLVVEETNKVSEQADFGRGGGLRERSARTLGAPGAPMAMTARGDAGAVNGVLAKGADREPAGGEALVQPTVRTKFADTALWVATLETDKNGEAASFGDWSTLTVQNDSLDVGVMLQQSRKLAGDSEIYGAAQADSSVVVF